MATKKPTPAQLAARERFAAMARSGAFKRKPAAKRAKNPAPRELRNRWGVVIKKGNWVQGRTSRGEVVEGVIAKIERTGDYARAYGPRVVLTNGVSLGIDDVAQTLGPMTVDPSGIVRQNPLTRVKRNSPSMATGEAPSARLKKRRAKTAKAPAGYYANPRKPLPFRSVYVEDDGGFSFGMDEVTPVAFTFSTAKDSSKKRGVYRSWGLPDNVVKSEHFQAWARGANGRVFASLRDLRATLKKIANIA